MTTKFHTAPNGIAARDALCFEAIRGGLIVFTLAPLQLGRLTVYVMADALRFGVPGDSVRLGMSAKASFEALEMLEMMPHTCATADAAAAAAAESGGLVGPFVRETLGIVGDRESMSTSAMVRHSRAIDAALPDGYEGIVSGWKHKVLHRGLWGRDGRQCNYGWHAKARGHVAVTRGDLAVIQPPQFGHSAISFCDYSEFVDGVSWYAENEGRGLDLRDVIVGRHGEALAHEVSHEGPLPDWRPPYADRVQLISTNPPGTE